MNRFKTSDSEVEAIKMRKGINICSSHYVARQNFKLLLYLINYSVKIGY